MTMSFNLYYFSQDTGVYMQEAVRANNNGNIAHSSLLDAVLLDLPVSEADVHFIEYKEEVPELDHWIETIQHNGHTAVFLYLQQANTENLLKALRLGVQECFVGTIPEKDFHKAINRLLQIKTTSYTSEKSQVLALLGCKGGAGATFIAVNLAQTLFDLCRQPTLLLDLDLRSGNVSSFLNIQPRYTILDVIENFDRIDPQYLKDIIHHNDSGLDVLPGPARLEDSELVQAHHVEKILSYVRSQNLYRWIILDLGDILDELTLKALELSDLILLITLLTIPGLKDAKKILDMFQLLEFPEDKIKLVVNCHNKDTDIKETDAKKFLGQDIFSTVRYEHTSVIRSINEGQPLVKTLPRHRLSQDFLVLAKQLNPKDEDNGHRSWGLAGIKRLLRLRS